MTELTFYSDARRRPKTAHPDSPTEPVPYVAAEPLKQAVNLAMYLHRPLLLEGEAGCGKTRLASAVAYELGLPFYAWHVRSTSKAREGLYTYDAILRLHDVQTYKLTGESWFKQFLPSSGGKDPRDPTAYRTWGALGKAFNLKSPAVVLIDEIDKAELDFPNDLLTVLDEWQFDVPETGETLKVAPQHRPIVIITSNKEKGNLPAPFLRRCLYYFLQFPDEPEKLREIITAHQSQTSKQKTDLLEVAIKRFLELRQMELHKKPGTSELLDWLKALQNFGPTAPYSAEELANQKEFPFPELLFKLRADWQTQTL